TGGDEFAILIYDTELDSIKIVQDRIQTTARDAKVQYLPGKELRIGIDVGASFYFPSAAQLDSKDLSEKMKACADQQMYSGKKRSKELGRDMNFAQTIQREIGLEAYIIPEQRRREDKIESNACKLKKHDTDYAVPKRRSSPFGSQVRAYLSQAMTGLRTQFSYLSQSMSSIAGAPAKTQQYKA
ncbi:MAG: GGDEF domain-containing protein, partial [Candidatus Woesearchaeota archaeon]|nr:GGDEF domain-containing protein [Candidatus Woesearchaeota archaeon]